MLIKKYLCGISFILLFGNNKIFPFYQILLKKYIYNAHSFEKVGDHNQIPLSFYNFHVSYKLLLIWAELQICVQFGLEVICMFSTHL